MPAPAPTPSAAQFAALARSSPWRWSTLRFTASWRGRAAPDPVRAWIRRPHSLRVESLTGRLLQAGHEEPAGATALVSSTAPGGDTRGERAAGVPVQPRYPGTVSPELDEAGLVVRRPGSFDVHYDAPMYQTYQWVAMLDPVELADGLDSDGTGPLADPIVIGELAAVEHHGRAAWQAVVHTTPAYDPRCSCCPLLFGRHSEDIYAAGATPLRDREAAFQYADAYRVRLDVATGVCVLTEEVGGSSAGSGHELTIEAVDEHYADDLFGGPPGRRRRTWPLGRG